MNSFLRSSLLLVCSSVGVGGTSLDELKVLFVGDSGSARTREYTSFLQENVGAVEYTSRNGFQQAQSSSFDVVLLDWPQSRESRLALETKKSPLGARNDWNRPTVLLGSAGLNLAVTWDLRGGSG